MNTNRTSRMVIMLVVALAFAAAAYWYFFMRPAVEAAGALTASGTIETTEIAIAPELTGRIVEIKANEGDTVKAGDVLFRLDESLLQAQRNVSAMGLESARGAAASADAAVASAQSQYDIALSAALVQDKSNRSADWYKGTPGDFTLPEWYYSQTELLTAAQTEADAAKAAFADAQKQLALVGQRAASAEFAKAETDLAAAQVSFEVANNLYNRTHNGKNIDEMTRRQLYLLTRDARLIADGKDPKWVTAGIDQDLRDASKKLYDDARSNLKDAQTAYDDAVTTQGADDVLKARADVSIAQERYYTALDFERVLQTGADAPAVTAAQKVLEQAQSAAAQARMAVAQAQANLALIDAQNAKSVITAPADGVVLSRAVETGSVVNPGSVLLSLGRLDDLTITVYVPEDRIGEVALGQKANVSVDSFPGETFGAVVTYISDQAEFTPRNVQTVEGRKNTVFAVKLKLDNTSGKLKPGMPGDVSFGSK